MADGVINLPPSCVFNPQDPSSALPEPFPAARLCASTWWPVPPAASSLWEQGRVVTLRCRGWPAIVATFHRCCDSPHDVTAVAIRRPPSPYIRCGAGRTAVTTASCCMIIAARRPQCSVVQRIVCRGRGGRGGHHHRRPAARRRVQVGRSRMRPPTPTAKALEAAVTHCGDCGDCGDAGALW